MTKTTNIKRRDFSQFGVWIEKYLELTPPFPVTALGTTIWIFPLHPNPFQLRHRHCPRIMAPITWPRLYVIVRRAPSCVSSSTASYGGETWLPRTRGVDMAMMVAAARAGGRFQVPGDRGCPFSRLERGGVRGP